MDTKLTLRLNKKVIEEVKVYADDHNTSLSQLVEGYFCELISDSSNERQLPLHPKIQNIAGILKDVSVDDYKKEYKESRIRKHS